MRKGFSLIEILIVVAIATSIVLVVSNLSGTVTVLNNLVSQELQAKSNVNQTLQIMTEDIQSAEPSANGSYAVDAASTSSFAFYSDPDADGIAEHVRYFLSSSTIYRGVIQPTGTPAAYPTSTEVVTAMVNNVTVPTSTPLFSYYDSSYTGTQPAMTSTAAVQSIRLIGISFSAAAGTGKSVEQQYFGMLVDIRNLRSN